MYAATVRDFEIPARYGLRQTIGDTIGVGGIFRALRTFPVLDGIAADMREICPDAWLLNYTNPMAMNIAYLAADGARRSRSSACATRSTGPCTACASCIDVPFDEVELPRRRRQPPGLAAALGARRREPLPAARRGDRRRPRAAPAGPRRHVPLGSATTRPRPASTPSEYVPWYLHHDARGRAAAHPGRRLRADQRGQPRRVRARPRDALLAGEPLDLERDATEYAPQVIHSMETGTMRADPRERRATRPDHQPARRATRSRCRASWTSRAYARSASATCRSQCAAVNRGFVSVGELTVRAAVDRRPAAWSGRPRMVDPNTGAIADRGRDLGAVRRAHRRARRPAARALRVPVTR